MIAMLSGVVDEVAEDAVVLDVNGVGYLVSCSERTLSALPKRGGKVRLEVETHVRDDRIELFGFADREERTWFRLLCGVQGVGAKTALAVLSVLSPDALAAAVASGDHRAVAEAERVGPKLASRIVSELRGKTGIAVPAPAQGPGANAAADAVSALVNLGYPQSEARRAVDQARTGLRSDATTQDVVRQALRGLAA